MDLKLRKPDLSTIHMDQITRDSQVGFDAGASAIFSASILS